METDQLVEVLGQEDESDPKSPVIGDKIPKEVLLVTLIGQEEPLFNHQHGDYRNHLQKDILWKQIAEKVGWNVPRCKSKWKAMRDQYCRELKRGRTNPHWTIRWKYFQHMEYLRPHALYRRSLFLVPSSYRPKFTTKTFKNTDHSQQESTSQDDEISSIHSTLKKESESWNKTPSETNESTTQLVEIHSNLGDVQDDEDDDPIRTFLNIESYFESELIKLIKAEEILYNHKKRSYRNVKLKQEIWEDIAKKLNRTVRNCRAKWKSLRDQYIREYRRLRKYSMCKNLKPWKHYDSLSFLEPYFRQKSENGNLESVSKLAANISSDEELDQEEVITETTAEDHSSSLFISVAENNRSRSLFISENQETTLQNSIETNYSSRCDDEHSMEEETMYEFSKDDTAKDTDDEVGVFFRAVAMKIRNAKMTSAAFTDLQIDILQVIMRQCRTKWKALRDQYIREHRRLLNLSNGKELLRWKHYDALSFLEPYVRQKSENGKLESFNKLELNISSEELDEEEIIAESTEEDHSRSLFISENQETTLQNCIDTNYPDQCDDEDSIEEGTVYELLKDDTAKDTDDEVGVFFRAVAMKIRNAKMSSTAFTDLQIDILQVINKALRD